MPIFDSIREATAKRKEELEKQRLAEELANQARIKAEKERQAKHDAAVSTEKSRLIERNYAFFEQVLSLFQPDRFNGVGWITQQETYDSTNIRYFFIGYNSLHIYLGSLPHDPFDKEKVWPSANFYFAPEPGQMHRIAYNCVTFSYPDHFCYAPISEYVNRTVNISFSKEEVLQLVAEEIHNQLKQRFPAFVLGDLEITKLDNESHMYFYFEYRAPYKELTSW